MQDNSSGQNVIFYISWELWQQKNNEAIDENIHIGVYSISKDIKKKLTSTEI